MIFSKRKKWLNEIFCNDDSLGYYLYIYYNILI